MYCLVTWSIYTFTMLWFRMGAVIAIVFTIFLSLALECGTLLMCVDPTSAKAMNSDPFYNGTLFFYVLIIISQVFMMGACIFGFIIAFRTWRNNHQLDHKLRHLFTLWLAALGLSIVIVFVLGILGIVRYREVQEEIVSLFEIFARYSQDVKFVGSFERYQRENSCCGINGPEDWMTAQFKSGGNNMGAMGGYGGGGMDMSYMGSPSTGKCHLTPPTIPMGCGKKLVEEIHFTRAVYCSFLILEALSAMAAAVLGWYCFFYWIEKEVIIIPEDEVSNLIVIEPESSTSTVTSSVTASVPSTWSSNVFTRNGSQFSSFSRANNNSNSMYSRQSGSRSQRANSFSYNGQSASQSFYPNTRRSVNVSRYTKISNFAGANPSIGGPHADFLSMNPDEIANQNYSVYDYRNPSTWSGNGNPPPPNGNSFSSNRYNSYNPTRRSIAQRSEYSRNLHARSIHPQHYNSNESYHENTRTRLFGSNNFSRESTGGHYLKPKKPKKEHSFNHMLHKQEKALGGRVIAEMHIDHSRDPDPINSNMDIAKGKRGHRAHHATIAIIRKKNPPKPKTLISGPEKGHGQTGHLATDILDMSGGAAAARSLIDNIDLPVEHDQHLTEGKGYVNKLHKARKKKSQLDHPDADHPGHGPIHMKDGVVSAPSIDGSQAQSLVDNLLHAKPKPKKEAEPLVKPHAVKDVKPDPHNDSKHHAHVSHHHQHHHHHEHEYEPHGEAELLYRSKNFV